MRGSLPGVKAKDRLEAAKFLLALAGVRPSDQYEPEPESAVEQKRPAVLLNLFLGGSPEKDIRVIDGEARSPTPSRIAGAAIAALGVPETAFHWRRDALSLGWWDLGELHNPPSKASGTSIK